VDPSWRGDQDKIGARAKKIKSRCLRCGRDQVQIESELC
jgi:ribosomal protein L37E